MEKNIINNKKYKTKETKSNYKKIKKKYPNNFPYKLFIINIFSHYNIFLDQFPDISS